MSPTRKQRTSAAVRLNIGQIQLLSRIVDTVKADSTPESGESEYEIRRYQMLTDILFKLDAAIEQLERE